MPTILVKRSNTPSSVPTGSQLTNTAGGAEIAVNTADLRIYSMNSASAIIELGTNPSSITITNVNGGAPSNGQLLIGNGTGLTRSTLTAGSGVTVTNATGSITIASTGVTTGKSIAMAMIFGF